jgi:hypothetical protein
MRKGNTLYAAHWDSRRQMCRLCAMNAAEDEGHCRTRLTLHLRIFHLEHTEYLHLGNVTGL